MAGLPRPHEPSALLEIDDDLRGRFLDPRRHVEVLAPLSARHRRRGNARAAFAFADRYCRLTHHRDAYGLLLRAEASEDLGDEDGYRADVEASFKVDPMVSEAARRMLAIAPENTRCDIARLILANPRGDRESRLAAIDAVLARGFDVVSELRYDGQAVQGVLAWDAADRIAFSFDPGDGASWSALAPAATYRRSARELALAHLSPQPIRGPDAADAMMRAFRVRAEKRVLHRFEANLFNSSRVPTGKTAAPLQAVKSAITVVLPVFGDRRMTQLCLLALLRQKRELPDLRILVVDDNPERSVLTPTMTRTAEASGIQIVRNERNVGFARSVNRALEMVGTGDVLLLNADVLLPPGAIRRLAEASRGTPDIGTLTPFSNDGEEVSFPSCYQVAPLLPYRRVCALDRVASASNGSDVVEIVNGIGFCLYVTRQALDAVGRLPTIYERGYYEDVDFALAVRAAGFRNVCAAGVYVGHKGSGSFRGAKQALVARNKRILRAKYPTYVDESAAFLAADPLRPARAAIERAALSVEKVATLLVLPPCALSNTKLYCEAIGSTRCLCLTWPQDRADRFVLWMSDGSAPQSLHYEGAGALEATRDYLLAIGVEQAFVAGVAFEMQELIRQLRRSDIAIEMLFDDSLLQISSSRAGVECATLSDGAPCEICVDAFSLAPVRGHAGATSGLDVALKAARRVQPMNAMARAVARHFHLETGEETQKAASGVRVLSACAATTLGIVARTGDVVVERLLHAIVRHALRPGARMIVFGPCLDACRLMSATGVFVTGQVREEELERLFAAYDVDLLLAPSRWFGYGELERHGGDRPSAYFDWSGGLLRKHPRGLALDPRTCDRKIAHQIDDWWRGMRSSDDG